MIVFLSNEQAPQQLRIVSHKILWCDLMVLNIVAKEAQQLSHCMFAIWIFGFVCEIFLKDKIQSDRTKRFINCISLLELKLNEFCWYNKITACRYLLELSLHENLSAFFQCFGNKGRRSKMFQSFVLCFLFLKTACVILQNSFFKLTFQQNHYIDQVNDRW